MRTMRTTRLAAALLCFLLVTAVIPSRAERIIFASSGYAYAEDDTEFKKPLFYMGTYYPKPSERRGKDTLIEHLVHTTEDGYLYAQVAADEIYLLGYANTFMHHITYLPSEIDGIPVTGIYDHAFAYEGVSCFPFAEVVVIPSSVKVIGNFAFYMSDLIHVVLSEGLEEIGDYAFSNCHLTQMTLPSTVQKLGKNPFGLYDVDNYWDSNPIVPETYSGFFLPEGEELNNEHFWDTYDYDRGGSTLLDRDHMRLITFKGDQYKDYYHVQDGIEIIGDGAFSWSSGLKSVTLPDSVRIIEDNAFSYCYDLETVELSETLSYIGDYAFVDTALKRIRIPSSVSYIGENAFWVYLGNPTLTFVCDRGSYAEAYALENGFTIEYTDAGIAEQSSLPGQATWRNLPY